jgi:multiple sugar transport system permease protein
MEVNPMTEAVLPNKYKPRMTKKERNEALTFYLCVAPWIIGFLLFTAGPMIASLILSFTDWDILTPPNFIGLENFTRAFDDPNFFQALKVTLTFSIFAVPLRLLVALFLAMLLDNATRGVSYFRTSFYLPSIVSSVAAAVLFTWIFNPAFGPINGFLGLLGIQGPLWFEDPNYALWGLIIMSPWGVGGEMLIFLAGLRGIPKSLYEAAEIDGAGRLASFFNVTIPMLSPSLFFNLVMAIIGSFQSFDTAYVISSTRAGTAGDPLQSTLFFMIYLYKKAFGDLQMGYASALGWILFVIILVLTMLVVRSSSVWVYYETERKN